MRPIDADALLTSIEVKCPMEKDLDSFMEGMRAVLKRIYNAPTVDAVLVNEYRRIKFFNAEGIYEAFFPIKLNLDTVNRIQIGDEKFMSVVRCGECKHKCGECDGYIYCDVNDVWHDPKWFCAEGERNDYGKN